MSESPLAEAVAEIAERERKLAAGRGDYGWAILCALLELEARRRSRGDNG